MSEWAAGMDEELPNGYSGKKGQSKNPYSSDLDPLVRVLDPLLEQQVILQQLQSVQKQMVRLLYLRLLNLLLGISHLKV